MIEHNNEKQNEETNFIGKTRFYDKAGNIVESLNQEGKVLVINFPGSGMTFNGKDEDNVKKSAVETCKKTEELLPQDDKSSSQAFVCTAVYENKADKAIKEYNEENNNTHSNEIFEQILKPMKTQKEFLSEFIKKSITYNNIEYTFRDFLDIEVCDSDNNRRCEHYCVLQLGDEPGITVPLEELFNLLHQ